MQVIERVLFVSNLYPPTILGGAELVANRHAKGLAARGLKVTVLAGRLPDHNHERGSIDIDELDGILVYRVPIYSMDIDDNFYIPAIARHLQAIVATEKIELVHFHNLPGLGANLIPAAKAAGARAVVTLHDHWGFCFKNTLLRNDERLCRNTHECSSCRPSVRLAEGLAIPTRLRRDYVALCLEEADVLVSPSAYLAEAYRAAGIGARIERVSNGIDLTAVPATPRNRSAKVRFVCFSYLGAHKGIPVLLDAAEKLAADNSLSGKWSLTIAGPGPLSETLRIDIDRGRFGTAVEYAGHLLHEDALELLRASDIVVLASIWPENEPVTMLETIATGRAQIASRIGGNPELVVDGQSGFLFEPRNVPDLVEKMRRYILDPELAEKHGCWNKHRRSEFDERTTLDRLIAIYDGLGTQHIPETSNDHRVVICSGEPIPKEISLLLHRFHIIEEGRFQARFIWHEWADAALWRRADLLWLWSTPLNFISLTRAIKQGLPVLAPKGSLADQLAHWSGNVVTYSTYLEALASVSALVGSRRNRRLIETETPELTRLLATLAPRPIFHLPIETPA